MSDPAPSLLEAVRRHAEAVGLNLLGTVVGEEFDQCQPYQSRASELLGGCGTILVLAAGGSAFWQAMVAANGDPGRPRPGHHPIDTRSRVLAAEIVAMLRANGCAASAVFPDDPRPLNFLQLAECAGLGTISPVIGLLLHPRFGPWVSTRAAILIQGTPFATPRERPVPASYQPCIGCAKPCVQACPVHVYDGYGGVDIGACARHRHAGGSADGCAVRRACPEGAAHRYGPREEAFRHAYSLFSMRKHFGLGWWKLVPRALR